MAAPPPPKQKKNGKKKNAEEGAVSESGSFSEGPPATPSPKQKKGKKKNGDLPNQPRKSIDSMDEALENVNGNEADSAYDAAKELEADDMTVSSEAIDSTTTVEPPSETEPDKLSEEKSEQEDAEDVPTEVATKNEKSKKGKKKGGKQQDKEESKDEEKPKRGSKRQNGTEAINGDDGDMGEEGAPDVVEKKTKQAKKAPAKKKGAKA